VKLKARSGGTPCLTSLVPQSRSGRPPSRCASLLAVAPARDVRPNGRSPGPGRQWSNPESPDITRRPRQSSERARRKWRRAA
jgi:hypothetical protein